MAERKTNELTDAALDWAVAKCEGVETKKYKESPSLFFGKGFDKWRPSTDWAQGGPIIEREWIDLHSIGITTWRANVMNEDGKVFWADGPTPLIAAMRCYVTSKLGLKIDVPDELI
jgi:hypothetical protein